MPKKAESQLHNGKFYGTTEERIGFIAMQVVIAWSRSLPSIVVIEDYAFSKNQRGAAPIRELGGVIKHYLWVADAAVVPLAPRANKLEATGTGTASKQEMIARAKQLWPSCPDNENVADAFHLARYGLRNFAKLVETT